MRNLLVLSAGIALLMIVSMVIVRGVGANQPVSDRMRRWHFTDCRLPCWAGISIGRTSESETEERMKTMFQPPMYAVNTNRWQPGNSLFMSLKATGDNGQPQDVSVSFGFENAVTASFTLTAEDLPSVGDMLNLLGTPSCVFTGNAGSNYLILYFGGLKDGESITIGFDPPAWNTPIKVLGIGRDMADSCKGRPAWRGFVSAKG